jgi:hypothetical protein
MRYELSDYGGLVAIAVLVGVVAGLPTDLASHYAREANFRIPILVFLICWFDKGHHCPQGKFACN